MITNLLALSFFFIALTGSLILPQDKLESTYLFREAQKSPYLSSIHASLTQGYRAIGKHYEAEKEMKLVGSTPKHEEEVLGEKSPDSDQEKQKAYWEKLVKNHPTYEDGWIQLLYISHSLNDEDSKHNAYQALKKLNPSKVEELPKELQSP